MNSADDMIPSRPGTRGQTRRHALGLAGLATIATAIGEAGSGWAQQAPQRQTAAAKPFAYADVVRQARIMGENPFDASAPTIPAELKSLTYDSYREIRFQREKALWRTGGSAFRLHPFHLGFLHDKPVQLHLIRDGQALPVPFTTSMFEYGKVPTPRRLPLDLGFAGFAVTTTLNRTDIQDEIIAFLGASYFRLIGRGHRYGLSARSLALDVGGPRPEEFPFFRSLWLDEPGPESQELTIYALVDSPSVCGAFRYVVSPGKVTSMTVTATIVPRRAIDRLGIAPLTSMYLAGEGDLGQRTDFRPEIHDSDGLLLQTGRGEWIWRPIRNPKTLHISSFVDDNPRGFGLMQRDREFGHYQDLEAQYHSRPGYWVEPLGDWGAGRVDLVEIPTTGEVFDNIVSCWTPAAVLTPGKPHEFTYRLTALSTTEMLHDRGQVSNTFFGDDVETPDSEEFAKKRFIIDFQDGDLAYYLADPRAVEIIATTTNAASAITKTILDANPTAKGFRAIVDATLRPGKTTEVRVFLKSRGKTLTETWTSSWSAAPPIAVGATK